MPVTSAPVVRARLSRSWSSVTAIIRQSVWCTTTNSAAPASRQATTNERTTSCVARAPAFRRTNASRKALPKSRTLTRGSMHVRTPTTPSVTPPPVPRRPALYHRRGGAGPAWCPCGRPRAAQRRGQTTPFAGVHGGRLGGGAHIALGGQHGMAGLAPPGLAQHVPPHGGGGGGGQTAPVGQHLIGSAAPDALPLPAAGATQQVVGAPRQHVLVQQRPM